MIPEFPAFKKLEVTDRNDVENVTHRFPHYSDFDFTSLWSWNCDDKVRLSMLNGNIVVQFTDYLTSKPFYSFIGAGDPNDTATKLLDLSSREGLGRMLRLVPADAAKEIDPARFSCTEDPDNFDYILDCALLADYDAGGLRGHASFKRRFIEEYGSGLRQETLNLGDPAHQKLMLSLNARWVENKVAEKKDVYPEAERKAIERLFSLGMPLDSIVALGVFYYDRIIAYVIDERVSESMAISHFMKADTSFKGAYSYIVSAGAETLRRAGVKYINVEQDLGLKNLRQSKRTFEPAEFLKKYKIEPVDISS